VRWPRESDILLGLGNRPGEGEVAVQVKLYVIATSILICACSSGTVHPDSAAPPHRSPVSATDTAYRKLCVAPVDSAHFARNGCLLRDQSAPLIR
jgi:hypothetical protein